jgi:hypothetical protein
MMSGFTITHPRRHLRSYHYHRHSLHFRPLPHPRFSRMRPRDQRYSNSPSTTTTKVNMGRRERPHHPSPRITTVYVSSYTTRLRAPHPTLPVHYHLRRRVHLHPN